MRMRVPKHRSIFALGNIVFTQDHIFWRGQDYYFVEVRGLSGKKAQESFFRKLGLENVSILHQSYLELFGET